MSNLEKYYKLQTVCYIIANRYIPAKDRQSFIRSLLLGEYDILFNYLNDEQEK